MIRTVVAAEKASLPPQPHDRVAAVRAALHAAKAEDKARERERVRDKHKAQKRKRKQGEADEPGEGEVQVMLGLLYWWIYGVLGILLGRVGVVQVMGGLQLQSSSSHPPLHVHEALSTPAWQLP